jgi:hypothetical protein
VSHNSEHCQHSDLQARAKQLLPPLKREAIARGRSATEIDKDRRVSRALGHSVTAIAAYEFARIRLCEDLDESVAIEIRRAAILGTPSAVSMALAERDGYCPDCFRHWYYMSAEFVRDAQPDSIHGLVVVQ